MRVIHHDGRVGDAPWRQGFFTVPIEWDEGGFSIVDCADLRPLGPIEEELRSSTVVNDEIGLDCFEWSEETIELFDDCRCSLGIDVVDDLGCTEVDSEALEACARIWEQHGVAL